MDGRFAAVERLLAAPPKLHEEAPGRLTTWALGDEVLRFLADRVEPGGRTLETGAGVSTILFALLGARHTCVTPEAGEVERIRAWCGEHGVSLDDVRFVVAPSEDALPRLPATPLDLVLVDGSHALPHTFLDWFYAARRLVPGGLAVVDNTDVHTGRLLADFLAEDPDWAPEASFPVAAVFRLMAPFRAKGWWQQPYVVRRSDLTVLAEHSDLGTFVGVRRRPLVWALLRKRRFRVALRWLRRGLGEAGGLLARSEGYDRQLERLALRALGPEANVVDVGAHTGEVLDRLRRICPRGRHFAFEPLPQLAAGLRQRFPAVAVHEVALAEAAGRRRFRWVVNDPAYSGLEERTYDRPDPVIEEIEVRVERLDDLLPPELPVALVKVDVEGGELGVLRGAVRTLRRWRPFVVFEASPKSTSHYGVGAGDLYDFLAGRCGLAVTTMRRWLDRHPPFDRAGFEAAFGGDDFVFLAHRPEAVPIPRSTRLRRWKLRLLADGGSRTARTLVLLDRGRQRLRNDGWGAFLRRLVRVHRWGRQILAGGAAVPVPARSGRGGVLVIDWKLPSEDHNAAALRLRRILRLFRGLGLAVDLLPHDLTARRPAADELRREGVGVVAGAFQAIDYLRAAASTYDLCWIGYADLAEYYVPLVEAAAPELPIVFDTVDLHFLREERRAAFDGDPRSAARYRALELDLVRRTAATVVVTEAERRVLLAEVPGADVHVLPTIHVPRRGEGRPFGERRGLLFVGSFPFAANGDAAVWFVEEVLPRVRRSLGEVPVHLVGPQPGARVRALADRRRGVHVPGWVPDLEPLYRECRLSIAPLRWGAGMKGKIGEAMARGLPVVATSIGAEGMGLEHGVDVLIGDGAAAFADEVVRLYRDEVLWHRLAEAGLRRVEAAWSPAAVQDRLAEIVAAAGGTARRLA